MPSIYIGQAWPDCQPGPALVSLAWISSCLHESLLEKHSAYFNLLEQLKDAPARFVPRRA